MANLSLILFFLAIITANHSTLTTAQTGGFSIGMIRRDSPSSPFHNPNETPAQRLRNALTRSITRAHTHFAAKTGAITTTQAGGGVDAPITAANGEYLINVSIGTPPFPISAVADTGSNLIWTQCKPCVNCYDQDGAVFDPESSSTYKPAPCGSKACTAADQSVCRDSDDTCVYGTGYGDGSYTIGDVAVDTLTLGSTEGGSRNVALPNTVIGCGHNNSGRFQPDTSGIVGLGRGPASLVSQLGLKVAGKFSYCLVPYGSEDSTSTLSFGSNAVVSGAVTTPLVANPADVTKTFYSVKLDAVSVGSERLPFEGGAGQRSRPSAGPNVIVDSGTTLTIFPQAFAGKLVAAVAAQVTGGTRANDPDKLLSLCYEAGSDLKVPTITFHFGGGADVELAAENAFINISETEVCLAVGGDDGLGVSIIGNIAQQNFQVGYDTVKNTVSFKQTDCTKL